MHFLEKAIIKSMYSIVDVKEKNKKKSCDLILQINRIKI